MPETTTQREITIKGVTFTLPYADLLPPLSDTEYADLKADIEQRGVVVPILVDEHRNVIDGQHRLRIAHELGLTDFPVEIRPGLSVEERERLAWDLNAHRRHMTKEQRRELALKLRKEGKSYREIGERLGVSHEIARKDVSAPTVNNLTVDLPDKITGRDGKTRTATPKRTSVRVDTPGGAQKATDMLAALDTESLRDGTHDLADLKRAEKEAKREQRREELATLAARFEDTPDYRIVQCDIRHLSAHIERGSVDAIVTDPPYGKDALDTYAYLADFASYALKPGGSLLVMAGQSYLPGVLERLSALTYQWTICYATPGGQAPQIWDRKVNTFWKPVLWYVQGEYTGNWIGDVVETPANANDKRFHEWGQGEIGMAKLIELVTRPGEMVVDPFLGGGTTGVVALNLKRRFFGSDVNEGAVHIARGRLAEAQHDTTC